MAQRGYRVERVVLETPAPDLLALWDFADPAASEARFRERLDDASHEVNLSLRTQIARTHSLRGQFAQAHQLLDGVDAELAATGAEPRVRSLLERGRTWRSAREPAKARPLFQQAAQQARAAGLDYLHVDALHMVALVETTAEAQLDWNRRALAAARESRDPQARRWEASLSHNIGYTLHEAGRHDEALQAFRDALAALSRFTKMVPGFDFLPGLMKGAGSSLPSMSQWIAPTLDAEEVDKRIQELRTVQFWLEQNAKMLGATIQALEVQRMTLATLKTMNLPMSDLRESMKLDPTPSCPRRGEAGASRRRARGRRPRVGRRAEPAPPAVDPMQWWGALTRSSPNWPPTRSRTAPVEAATDLAGAAFKQSRAADGRRGQGGGGRTSLRASAAARRRQGPRRRQARRAQDRQKARATKKAPARLQPG
jgi:tetratricopeptide (TPR) repeat protein